MGSGVAGLTAARILASSYEVTLYEADERLGGHAHTRDLHTDTAVGARKQLPRLSEGVTAYAGARHGWGFHEDGCRCGAAAARSLGARW
ncbi:NAD(P)-binding protein [Streptomyces sp. W1SF4]|uniref:NAD(P)-binding protein n=1 Tax=Streptomyces sp. W1SF4 TaxID=2305220 RepID=UPI0024086D31|nr:NAD(P)-binding protein [Streptomyces sp. W1SF4]